MVLFFFIYCIVWYTIIMEVLRNKNKATVITPCARQEQVLAYTSRSGGGEGGGGWTAESYKRNAFLNTVWWNREGTAWLKRCTSKVSLSGGKGGPWRRNICHCLVLKGTQAWNFYFYFFCRNRILMVPRACNTRFLKIVFDSAEIFDF